MSDETSPTECPPDLLTEAVDLLASDEARGRPRINQLLQTYPRDARLHFLQGSLLAGEQSFGEALIAMARAVEIAPGFTVARFQLGFLQLTSGLADAALATWAPLEALPADEPLRIFAQGLGHLIRDEFGQTIETLEKGIRLNTANPPLNRDMQLIIDQSKVLLAGGAAGPDTVTASHLLLRQYVASDTKH